MVTKTVGVGTLLQFPPGTSPLKRKAVVPAESPAAKQPHFELLSSQDSEEVPSLGSEDDPTYHPSPSKLDDNVSER